LAAAEDDGARVAGEPDLAADEQGDREQMRRTQALPQERHREERDPDDERLLDEGGLRRLRAREAFEEEDEGHAAADHRDDREREPAARADGARRPAAHPKE